MSGETIAAIATGAAGCAGRRALIRVSGPVAMELAQGRHEAVAVSDGFGRGARGVGVVRVRVGVGVMGGADVGGGAGAMMPALAAWFAEGASYTGEATLELLVPGGGGGGGGVVAAMVLASICGVPGVRHAVAGEFTARAYEGGRMSLVEAEGVAAMIAAENQQQAAAARAVLSGEMGRVYVGWAERITRLRALVEAGIDFAEEEGVVAIDGATLRRRCAELVDEIDARLERRAGGERISGAARVVMAGRPNAGKSTLFNALLGRRRAITSAIAGTTRDALREMVTLRGSAGRRVEIELVDAAGVDGVEGGVGGEVERLMGESARAEVRGALVVLWCDERGVFDPAALGEVVAAERLIRVRTKRDRPGVEGFGGGGEVGVSAIGGEGLVALRARVFEMVWRARGGGGARMELLPRHAGALGRARDALSDVVRLIDAGCEAQEAIAEELVSAGGAIGELTGRVERDEVLGVIFASFCIGK